MFDQCINQRVDDVQICQDQCSRFRLAIFDQCLNRRLCGNGNLGECIGLNKIVYSTERRNVGMQNFLCAFSGDRFDNVVLRANIIFRRIDATRSNLRRQSFETFTRRQDFVGARVRAFVESQA